MGADQAISDAILGFQESARVHCQRLIDYYIGELTAIRFEQLTAEVLLQSFYNRPLA